MRQAGPNDKPGDAAKGIGVAKCDFTKTFRNQLFFMGRWYYIINLRLKITVKIFVVQNNEHFNDYFFVVFFLSDF